LQREGVDNAKSSSSSSSNGCSSSSFPAVLGASHCRQLTMAEIRLAEQQPLTIPIPPFAAVQACALAKKEAVDRQRKFSMKLHVWIKQHRHLRAVDVDCGEPSVALLLLWELEHNTRFPCRTPGLSARVGLFTKTLSDVVTADSELRTWLHHRQQWMPLCIGLPHQHHVRWAVEIDSRIGVPFLPSWKAYLLHLVSKQQAGAPGVVPLTALGTASGALTGSPVRKRATRVASGFSAPRRLKRPRSLSGGQPHPQSKQARVARLAAALASVSSSESNPSTSTPSTSSTSLALASPPSGASVHSCGRAPSLGMIT